MLGTEAVLAIIFAVIAFAALSGSAVMYRVYLKKLAVLKGVEDVPNDHKLMTTSVRSQRLLFVYLIVL